MILFIRRTRLLTDKETRSVKVCITLRPEIHDKVVKRQIDVMKDTGSRYSYSRAVSDILEENLK